MLFDMVYCPVLHLERVRCIQSGTVSATLGAALCFIVLPNAISDLCNESQKKSGFGHQKSVQTELFFTYSETLLNVIAVFVAVSDVHVWRHQPVYERRQVRCPQNRCYPLSDTVCHQSLVRMSLRLLRHFLPGRFNFALFRYDIKRIQ